MDKPIEDKVQELMRNTKEISVIIDRARQGEKLAAKVMNAYTEKKSACNCYYSPAMTNAERMPLKYARNRRGNEWYCGAKEVRAPSSIVAEGCPSFHLHEKASTCEKGCHGGAKEKKCERTFKALEDLQQHLLAKHLRCGHHEIFCENGCGEAFPDLKSLENHSWVCNISGDDFEDTEEYKLPVQSAKEVKDALDNEQHMQEVAKEGICNICQKHGQGGNFHFSDLRGHFKDCHGIGDQAQLASHELLTALVYTRSPIKPKPVEILFSYVAWRDLPLAWRQIIANGWETNEGFSQRIGDY